MSQDTTRPTPLDISRDEFKRIGHQLVDEIADLFDGISDRPLTRNTSPADVRDAIGRGSMPADGMPADQLIADTTRVVMEHSLYNAHPKFLGYITAGAAPIGVLGDFLASAVNPNAGAWTLSPVATEIEQQSIRWIAELIDFPVDCGGVLVSGGNVANFVCFLAARRACAQWDIAAKGLCDPDAHTLRVYASAETHTWLYKAMDMYGLGSDQIRWIDTDDKQRMLVSQLEEKIKADVSAGDHPFLVVGTAGSVSTGAVDPLLDIERVCKAHKIWLHIDGAYGAFAAMLPDRHPDMAVLGRADSVALDPHKWLYAPLEAGCALVRDEVAMRAAFSYHPDYYKFKDESDDRVANMVDFGPQNSRGFRALKVWLSLKQAGRRGYESMIREDIALAKRLYDAAIAHPLLQAFDCNLSIATFRYLPDDLDVDADGAETYLNALNEELLTRLQAGGEAFVSNAVIAGAYVLRACVVNFRTTNADVDAVPEIVIRLGAAVDAELRPDALKS